jgi:hypothetical protein
MQRLPVWKPEYDHLKDIGIDGSVILGWVLKKEDWRSWIGFIWP